MLLQNVRAKHCVNVTYRGNSEKFCGSRMICYYQDKKKDKKLIITEPHREFANFSTNVCMFKFAWNSGVITTWSEPNFQRLGISRSSLVDELRGNPAAVARIEIWLAQQYHGSLDRTHSFLRIEAESVLSMANSVGIGSNSLTGCQFPFPAPLVPTRASVSVRLVPTSHSLPRIS